MPLDHHGGDDDDEKVPPTGAKTRFGDWDCPDCNANNPADPPIGDGDEILCNYCGTEFKVKVSDEGKAKFKQM